MRDYVLNYYDVNTRFVELKYRNKKIKYIQHAKKHIYNFVSSFFMNYAIIQISIFDFDLKLCLNIEKNVSLYDRSLLSQNRNYYNLDHRIKFITIIEVVDIQILNQYIKQKMLLNFNKISVFVKIYLINNFQFDLIINMNVLNKNNIDLLLNRQTLKVKNIEILFCYTSSSLLINKSYCLISQIDECEKNYYFYHFVVDQSNRNNIIRFSIKK